MSLVSDLMRRKHDGPFAEIHIRWRRLTMAVVQVASVSWSL